LSAATALLAAAGITGLPHVGSYVSSAAVIDAPLLALRAPIDGMVIETSGRVGSAVAPGTSVFHVDASAESRSELEALKAALATAEAEIAAIEAQTASLEEMRTELTDRAARMTARGSERIAAQRAQAAARLAGAEAELARIATEIARTEKLTASGAVTEAQLEDHRFDRWAQFANIRALQSEIEALDIVTFSPGSGPLRAGILR
jgi:multidrug resistance efflux pump